MIPDMIHTPYIAPRPSVMECGNEAPSQSAYFSLFADARQCDLSQPGYHRVLG